VEDLEFEKFIQTYKKSEVVFSEGMTGKEMYIVYSGKIKLCSRSSEQSKVLTTLQAGDFFGEMALVDDSPRSATAIVDEDNTQLIVLDKKKFTYLLRHQPDFALVVMGRLCERVRELTKELTGWKNRNGANETQRKNPTPNSS
jgi:CRP/FNR family cyclic AMP-dependent transcriptional regulator